MTGQNLKEVLECDLKAEYGARELYAEARKHCQEVGDHVTMMLLETLPADERGHIDEIETELALIEKIGIEIYGLLGGRGRQVAPH